MLEAIAPPSTIFGGSCRPTWTISTVLGPICRSISTTLRIVPSIRADSRYSVVGGRAPGAPGTVSSILDLLNTQKYSSINCGTRRTRENPSLSGPQNGTFEVCTFPFCWTPVWFDTPTAHAIGVQIFAKYAVQAIIDASREKLVRPKSKDADDGDAKSGEAATGDKAPG